MPTDVLIACPECDTLHRKVPLVKNSEARCTRCGAMLYQRASGSLDRALAISLAALITFAIANAFPIVALQANGMSTRTTLFGAVLVLVDEDFPLVALIVFFTTIVFPLAEIGGLLYTLLPLRLRRRPPGFDLALRTVEFVRGWGMIEVFVLGILVALVKLSSMARVLPGAALYAFCVLSVLMALLVGYFDQRTLWDRADRLHQRQRAEHA